jgi:hypothetical protein
VSLSPAGRELTTTAPPLLQETFTTAFGALADWEQTMILASLQRLVSLFEARELSAFTDVRELQHRLKAQGVELVSKADESTKGPASFVVVDPDGNPILVDQHR